MWPGSGYVFLYLLLPLLGFSIFVLFDFIVQFCVRLEAKLFFPAVAFEISPFADRSEPKTREHLQTMPGFGVNVPVEVVDSRGVIKDTNQLHSLVRHTANIGPRTRRRAVSSQGIPYSRVGSIAFQNASSISWSTDEVLHGLDLENTPWQDYDIPDELMRVLANTPMEILSIVRESIDNRRALKASMSAEASKLASSTTTPSVKPVSTGDKPATESSTSTRSQRAVSQVSAHTMDSTNPSRSSSPNQSIESTTTLGSSQDGDSKVSHHLSVPLQTLAHEIQCRGLTNPTSQMFAPKPLEIMD